MIRQSRSRYVQDVGYLCPDNALRPLWNTVYLGRAVEELRSRGEIIPDEFLAHVAPLGWEHVAFNGDYVWPTKSLENAFRPLRNPRAELLDAA